MTVHIQMLMKFSDENFQHNKQAIPCIYTYAVFSF